MFNKNGCSLSLNSAIYGTKKNRSFLGGLFVEWQ